MTQIEEATGVIQITSIPPGDAPEWVRRAWVDIILPCYPVLGVDPNAQGICTGNPDVSCGVQVPAAEALLILQQKSPGAYQWFARNCPQLEAGEAHLFFPEVCFRVVSGVRRQVLYVHDDMEGPFAHDWGR